MPTFCQGDYVGGVIVSPELVKSFMASARNYKRPWLIRVDGSTFFPAFVFCNNDKWFISTSRQPELMEVAAPIFARIKWHYEIDQ